MKVNQKLFEIFINFIFFNNIFIAQNQNISFVCVLLMYFEKFKFVLNFLHYLDYLIYKMFIFLYYLEFGLRNFKSMFCFFQVFNTFFIVYYIFLYFLLNIYKYYLKKCFSCLTNYFFFFWEMQQRMYVFQKVWLGKPRGNFRVLLLFHFHFL